jgi:hypothetical protein
MAGKMLRAFSATQVEIQSPQTFNSCTMVWLRLTQVQQKCMMHKKYWSILDYQTYSGQKIIDLCLHDTNLPSQYLHNFDPAQNPLMLLRDRISQKCSLKIWAGLGFARLN